MRYPFKVVSFIVLLTTMASAQTSEQSWDNLRALRAGERIQVVDQRLRSQDGFFLDFSRETVTFQVDSDPVTVSRRDVLRVSDPGRSKRWRNTLLGLGIGAAFGFVSGMGACEHLTDTKCKGSDRVAVGAGVALVYGGIGAGVGALTPQHTTIYRAERRRDQTTP